MQEDVIKLHKRLKGKLEIISKEKVSEENLALLYTPGVAEPCKIINHNPETVYDFTWKGNTIMIVTDGSAVLGLGDIGPAAALPVMEGKAILFKEFGGVNAIPICLNTKNVDEIVRTVELLAPAYGGVNLEDISAPRCFEIEQKLIQRLNIPVFHDDQHGTAIVVYAGLINAMKLTGRTLMQSKIVINGAGAAGIAIARFLLSLGAKNIILCDRMGAIYRGRKEHMNWAKTEIAQETNPDNLKGALADVLVDADIFIGVSGPNLVSESMIKTMKNDPIIFALANPVPEINPEKARRAGARIIATGRSDFPNQINNLLAFPGIFKAALLYRVKKITFEMKKVAAEAISQIIPNNKLSPDYFIPKATNKSIADKIVEAIGNLDLSSIKQ